MTLDILSDINANTRQGIAERDINLSCVLPGNFTEQFLQAFHNRQVPPDGLRHLGTRGQPDE